MQLTVVGVEPQLAMEVLVQEVLAVQDYVGLEEWVEDAADVEEESAQEVSEQQPLAVESGLDLEGSEEDVVDAEVLVVGAAVEDSVEVQEDFAVPDVVEEDWDSEDAALVVVFKQLQFLCLSQSQLIQ